MELIDSIKIIAQRFKASGSSIQTEEASKTSLILPFIQALGYDIFNPAEVTPEFTADIVDRKGEKIDYAIMSDNKPIMLIECKWSGTTLVSDNLSQLARYFMVVPARIAVLTNGLDYEFYSDIDEPKVLDKKPFFKFNINEINEATIRELKKYCKGSFSIDTIIPAAEELKYTNEMKKYLLDVLNEPDEDFVRLLTRKVYDGRLTSTMAEKFKTITKKALSQFISERVSDRLTSALQEEKASVPAETEPVESAEEKIITTQEELDAYNIVRAILCKVIPLERISLRDTQSYCGVLFDDNNRLPICRFYFGKTTATIGLFDANKKEAKQPLESPSDIYKYADQIIQVAGRYLADRG